MTSSRRMTDARTNTFPVRSPGSKFYRVDVDTWSLAHLALFLVATSILPPLAAYWQFCPTLSHRCPPSTAGTREGSPVSLNAVHLNYLDTYLMARELAGGWRKKCHPSPPSHVSLSHLTSGDLRNTRTPTCSHTSRQEYNDASKLRSTYPSARLACLSLSKVTLPPPTEARAGYARFYL